MESQNMRTTLTFTFSTADEANRALTCLEPDNKPLPDHIRIRTRLKKNAFIIHIEVDGAIETLLNTIDEFLTHINLINDISVVANRS